MIPYNVRSLGNGLVEINGFTDTTATILVRRGSIANVEYRSLCREIRIDIVGKELPIILRYLPEPEGDEMMTSLLDCMKDVPAAVKEDLSQIRAKEVAVKAKVEMMERQMAELKELLEKIVLNTVSAVAPMPCEVSADVETAGEPALDLSDYETLSEYEDKRDSEIMVVNDVIITILTMLLICLFISSGYIYISRLTMGFNEISTR